MRAAPLLLPHPWHPRTAILRIAFPSQPRLALQLYRFSAQAERQYAPVLPPLRARRSAMCAPCGKQFKDKKFCPICQKAHRADEDMMIQCDKCAYWVHAPCDQIDRETFDKIASSDDPYACPNCRGERTSTLLHQVLEKVTKEDRDRFFAEPVPPPTALNGNQLI